MTEFFDENTLRLALLNCSFGKQLHVFQEIDSTNDYLKKLCHDTTPIEGTLVYAEKQTQGRGRFSRNWDSPEGKGLWFSILFLPKKNTFNDLEWTQLGVKACQTAIRDLYQLNLDIRWPNDLYYYDKKVGGILTELVRQKNIIQRVVMGIGINISQNTQDFHVTIRDRAVSLNMIANQKVDRLALLVKIVSELENDYLKKNDN